MLRPILVAIGVSVMVLGGVLLAHGDDKDDKHDKDKNGSKKQHQAILDAVSGGTSSSNTGHTTLQAEHATQNAAHTTLQSEHAAQDTAHQSLSNKIDAVQEAVDALSGGGGGTSDLRGVTQNWDKILPANDTGGPCPANSSRFTCVMGGAAVRDNETGLVWEQAPDVTTLRTWFEAITHCAQRQVGGRKGWHLPMLEQLASLVDSSNTNPALPTGHPFTNVQLGRHWTASTFAAVPSMAWNVSFDVGDVPVLAKTNPFLHVWCVRGGQSFDGNTP